MHATWHMTHTHTHARKVFRIAFRLRNSDMCRTWMPHSAHDTVLERSSPALAATISQRNRSYRHRSHALPDLVPLPSLTVCAPFQHNTKHASCQTLDLNIANSHLLAVVQVCRSGTRRVGSYWATPWACSHSTAGVTAACQVPAAGKVFFRKRRPRSGARGSDLDGKAI